MHICFSLSIFKNLLFLLIFFNVFTVIDNEKIKKKEKKRNAQFFKMINSLYHLNNKSGLGLGY